MSDSMDDDLRERLKASLWFSIGKIVDEETQRLNSSATPQFIGTMTEMVWNQIESVARDLESFARHAGRATVTADDVLLITRRNDVLHGIMKEFIEKEQVAAAKEKGKKISKGKTVKGKGKK